ncbi:MAG: hypothetical protein Q8843_01810, partial [Candidatus Phytoplasma australasiaticum]|nr:hypothetical protein [Candidatus Phytoplasma australasiaticum]
DLSGNKINEKKQSQNKNNFDLFFKKTIIKLLLLLFLPNKLEKIRFRYIFMSFKKRSTKKVDLNPY